MKSLKIDERKRAAAIDAAQINWDQQMARQELFRAIKQARVLESLAALAANEFTDALDVVARQCPVKVGDLYNYISPEGTNISIKVSHITARLDTMEWRVRGRSGVSTLTTSIPFPKEQP